ncbi:DNA (cytosine-5-)-methyltransferase [Aeromicrobium sp. S22]|uniref:DNA cytosine methyltransferase n=1 Tax=Aeromicrobium sp. S22 TaxID=2662029 RepID=UPI00129EC546|nr:DNA cytosine methyltransferase [Aeromicrobium sp. S22]MRK01373.1 DNA (cytosine-5-)-methyltransferase [Aeromicrobium sp. S22]
MSPRMKMVDLFAGCGGLTAGFVATGRVDPVAAVEMDADAAATYAQNFGQHVHVGDIADWVGGPLPSADIVVGGPPCQGFSSLGKQDPADPRSVMWLHYVEALTKIQPRYFVLENVPQFLKSPQFLDFASEFESDGRLAAYKIEVFRVNAAEYGAPQNRRRAVVIGSLRGEPGVPLKPTGAVGGSVSSAWRGMSTTVVETDLPISSTFLNGRSVPGPFKLQDIHITRRPTELSKARYAAIPVGGDRRDLPDELKAPCWIKHTSGSADVMGRLHADRPSVTIRTEFFKPEKGRYLHPTADRPITHAEAALIQGFAEDFSWCGTKVSIAKQIGNAVPPPLANAIAAALLQHHDEWLERAIPGRS